MNIQSDSIYFWVGIINADGGNSLEAILEIYDSSGSVLDSESVTFTENSVHTMTLNSQIEINQPLSLIIKGDTLVAYNDAYVSINGWSFGLE